MSTKVLWTGRVLSGLIGVFMLIIGITTIFVRSNETVQGFAQFGYSADLIPYVGGAALLGAVLYVIPRTCILGAIMLTGYLGGAVATHTRLHDPLLFGPMVLGILLWLGVYLRDPRLRALIPFRT
jgi:hypothetical protein